MSKCPICKTPLVGDSFYDSDIHATVEAYERCQDGCGLYSYEASYGNWLMELGGTMLTGWHGDSNTRRKKRSFIYKRTIQRLRKSLQRKGQRKQGVLPYDKTFNHYDVVHHML